MSSPRKGVACSSLRCSCLTDRKFIFLSATLLHFLYANFVFNKKVRTNNIIMKKLIFMGVLGLFLLGSCNSKSDHDHEGHGHETEEAHNHDHEGMP